MWLYKFYDYWLGFMYIFGSLSKFRNLTKCLVNHKIVSPTILVSANVQTTLLNYVHSINNFELFRYKWFGISKNISVRDHRSINFLFYEVNYLMFLDQIITIDSAYLLEYKKIKEQLQNKKGRMPRWYKFLQDHITLTNDGRLNFIINTPLIQNPMITWPALPR